MEVHSIIGQGHLEAVYHECLEIEFENRKIPFVSKPQLAIYYKERKLKKYYIPDFILFKEIVLEIKAEKCFTKEDEAQIINILKISRHKTGLLINFGEQSLRVKRFINQSMEYIKGSITLQAILLNYWGAYCAWNQKAIRASVYENVRKILKCRTAQLGYHLYQCPKCSGVRLIPHSCKSRNTDFSDFTDYIDI